MNTYLNTFLGLVYEMCPYLLLGFFFAGLLHVFVPKTIYTKYLSQNNFRSVLYAALFGVPLPLCSCGVLPTAASLRKEGASKGATTAFLIATPQTGIDSILATNSLLGLPFAIIRPVAAFVTSLFGGALANKFALGKNEKIENNEDSNKSDDCCDDGNCSCEKSAKPQNKIVEVFRYGYVNMLQDVGKWLVIGLLVAGLITVFVPDSFFARFANYPLLNMFIVLIFAVPMYLCATGSIPIAAALMLKGLTPGAALVLLMAGPATSFASMIVVNKIIGKRSMLIYIFSIIIGAIVFGLIIDYTFPAEWFGVVSSVADNCHHTTAVVPWWKIAATIIFGLLLINAFFQKYFNNKTHTKMKNSTTYRIGGMSCNHCKNAVETNLQKLAGVKSVTVNLAEGTAEIEGAVSEEEVKKTVEGLGYEFKGKEYIFS